MENQVTLSEIQLDLKRINYASAKTKCDLALESVLRRDAIPILLARAEAIRSLPNPDLDLALKDVNEAISIEPNNALCQLSLGQVFHAMSIKAFDHGKSLCKPDQEQTLTRFGSLSVGTTNLLNSSSSASNCNPIFLPKEILYSILLPLQPSQKFKCLKLSKDWKRYLESEHGLWRVLSMNLKSGYGAVLNKPSSPLNLFARNSNNTLTLVEIKFGPNVSAAMLTDCFKSLVASRRTLKSLSFTGYLADDSALHLALKLAGHCRKLERLNYEAGEEMSRTFRSGYISEGDSEGERYFEELEAEDMEREDEELLEIREHIELDKLRGEKGQPEQITLAISELAEIHFGSCKLFSRAKVINLEYQHMDFGIDRSDFLNLLNASANTLTEISIKQDQFLRITSACPKKARKKETDPIYLPKLMKLDIKPQQYFRDRHEVTRTGVDPIRIFAPSLSKEQTLSCVQNLIINEAQNTKVANGPGPWRRAKKGGTQT